MAQCGLVCGGFFNLGREFESILAPLVVRVVGRGMARRSEAEMWVAFRELDQKIRSFSELRGCLVEQEADACAAADRLDLRVFSLNRKYDRLMKERTEAEEWVADVALLGVDTHEGEGERK